MTTPHLCESDFPKSDLARLESCKGDREALILFAEELGVRIGHEVNEYHDTIESEINETANQIALAADTDDDIYYDSLTRHISILKTDQMHFSVTSRPSHKLYQTVIESLQCIGGNRPDVLH
jgi:hypothetical protein